MEPSGFCTACKQPLPADTPLGGVCPQCLIKSGFYSGTAPEPERREKFAAPAIADLAPHFPQLEILELIGRGGMGAVYKARQPRLNRLVALKVLARERDADARFADRFLREAQALAQMNHPNIVTVHDFGEAGGHYYLVMEYVDGLNLRELERTKKLTPEEALAIVPPICDALQYAHQQGIVHRDIKPENILIDKQGRVKIADFGIAKLLGVSATDEPLTGEQQRVGTPLYMAPEQVEKPTTVDHRADIYSLGVVFYEMLTGELPIGRFAAPSQKVEIDVRLDEIVLRALEKEPGRRYQQVSEIKTEMETLSTPAAVTAPVNANVDPFNQRPVLVIASVFMGIMLLIGSEFLSGIRLVFWIVGFGFGLAVTLYRLFRSSSKPGNGAINLSAPDAEATKTRANAKSQLFAPAIGLIVSALVSLLPLLIMVPILISQVFAAQNSEPTYATWGVMMGVPVFLIAGLAAFIIFGASNMLRVKSRGTGIAASILAMITPPGLILGLPFGIWALVVLNREEVKAAFEVNKNGTKKLGSSPQAQGKAATDEEADDSDKSFITTLWVLLGIAIFIVILEPKLIPNLFNSLRPEFRQIIVWAAFLLIVVNLAYRAFTKGRNAFYTALWSLFALVVAVYFIFPKALPYAWKLATTPQSLASIPPAKAPPPFPTPYFRLTIFTIPAEHVDVVIEASDRLPATYPSGIIPMTVEDEEINRDIDGINDVSSSSVLSLLSESKYATLTDTADAVRIYDKYNAIKNAYQSNGFGLRASIGSPHFEIGKFRSSITLSNAESALLTDLQHNITIRPENSTNTLHAVIRYNGEVGDKEVLVGLMPYAANGKDRYVVIALDKTATSSEPALVAETALKDQKFPEEPVLHYQNGARARLVAVASAPDGKSAWTADGLSTGAIPQTPFNKLPPEIKPGEMARDLYILIDKIHPDNIKVKAEMAGERNGMVSHVDANYFVARYTCVVPENTRETSLTLGIAATHWTQHFTKSLGNISTDYIDQSSGKKVSVLITQPDYQSDKVVVPLVHNANGMDVQLVLQDSNGKHHPGIARISSSAGDMNSVRYEYQPLNPGVKYTSLSYRTRPYEWKTFERIALNLAEEPIASSMPLTQYPATIAQALMNPNRRNKLPLNIRDYLTAALPITTVVDFSKGNYLSLDINSFTTTSELVSTDDLTSLGVHLYRSPYQDNLNALTGHNLKLAPLEDKIWEKISLQHITQLPVSFKKMWKDHSTPGVIEPGVYLFDTGKNLGAIRVTSPTNQPGVTVEIKTAKP